MSRTVLLALHYQNDVMHPAGRIRLGTDDETRRARLIDAAHALLSRARAAALPIIHVRIAFPPGYRGVQTNAPIFVDVVASGAMQEGSWGAEFFEGLEPRTGEPVVTHCRVNAFFDSPLAQTLRELDAVRLVMAGVATNSVVEHSARHAADLGFEVVVAADACSAADPAVHDAALFNLSLVGKVSTVDAIFAEAGE